MLIKNIVRDEIVDILCSSTIGSVIGTAYLLKIFRRVDMEDDDRETLRQVNDWLKKTYPDYVEKTIYTKRCEILRG